LSTDVLDPAPEVFEPHTIPEASTALPATAEAEHQNAEPTSPSSPNHPTFHPESDPSAATAPPAESPFKSVVKSFTAPTTGKPSDGVVGTDPKTGVAMVYPTSWLSLTVAK